MMSMPSPRLGPLEGGKWKELLEDYTVNEAGQQIRVPIGFVFDGASIPVFLRGIYSHPFDQPVVAPALIHDWLYYNHQVSQTSADDILELLFKKNDIPLVNVQNMMIGVRMFGHLFWHNTHAQVLKLVGLCRKVRHLPQFTSYHFPQDIIAKADLSDFVIPA